MSLVHTTASPPTIPFLPPEIISLIVDQVTELWPRTKNLYPLLLVSNAFRYPTRAYIFRDVLFEYSEKVYILKELERRTSLLSSILAGDPQIFRLIQNLTFCITKYPPGQFRGNGDKCVDPSALAAGDGFCVPSLRPTIFSLAEKGGISTLRIEENARGGRRMDPLPVPVLEVLMAMRCSASLRSLAISSFSVVPWGIIVGRRCSSEPETTNNNLTCLKIHPCLFDRVLGAYLLDDMVHALQAAIRPSPFKTPIPTHYSALGKLERLLIQGNDLPRFLRHSTGSGGGEFRFGSLKVLEVRYLLEHDAQRAFFKMLSLCPNLEELILTSPFSLRARRERVFEKDDLLLRTPCGLSSLRRLEIHEDLGTDRVTDSAEDSDFGFVAPFIDVNQPMLNDLEVLHLVNMTSHSFVRRRRKADLKRLDKSLARLPALKRFHLVVSVFDSCFDIRRLERWTDGLSIRGRAEITRGYTGDCLVGR